MEIRQAYVAALAAEMEKNPKIVVVDADLAGCGGTKSLQKDFSERLFNVGVAECNMTSIAAGLAAYGFVPFIHSFAPFASRRNFDQIAIGVSYSNQNVKIVALDPGISAEYNGGTHMTFEDVALMRALPNITVVDVADYNEMNQLLPQIANLPTAVYIRMPRKFSEKILPDGCVVKLGKATKIYDGSDITIAVSGFLAKDAKAASEALQAEGMSVDFLVFNTVKPLDEKAILDSAKKTKCVLTVENHSVHGGFFSAVTELLSTELPTLCDAVAIFDKSSQVGKLDDLKADYGLTADDIYKKAKALFLKKQK